MTIRTTLIASGLIAASLVSGAAQAALQGRDLDGNLATFEAYYDTGLDITWLADANYGAGSIYDDIPFYGGTTTDGRMTWDAANTWAANLSLTDAVNNITYDNWRLPTTTDTGAPGAQCTYSGTDCGHNVDPASSEMAHLYFTELGNVSYYTTSGEISGAYAGGAIPYSNLDNTGPFTNFQRFFYWSATEYAPGTAWARAWYFSFDDGGQRLAVMDEAFNALAVSPGDVGAVPEAETWAMLLAGLTLVGVAVRRRRG